MHISGYFHIPLKFTHTQLFYDPLHFVQNCPGETAPKR